MKYFRPKSFNEFYELFTTDCTLLAGGTDLIPRYERGNILPKSIADIKNLPDVSGIKEVGNNLEIGASTTIEEIKNNDFIKKNYTALHQSTIDFGSVQIRNRATIGGNICNASPAGDTLPSLYAFGAKLLLQNKNGNRLVNIEDFILGPGKTEIKEDEILQKIILPKSSSESTFYKLGLREAMAISVINFAVVNGDNELTIAVGAVAPTILKFTGLAKFTIEQIINKIDESVSPIDDIRATANYRQKVLKNMLSYELLKIIN